MNLKLSDYLNPPAIVQEKKRYATFKITPIGGPAELAIWRAEQAKKLAAYQLRRSEQKDKATEIVAGGTDAPLGELTWKGKALLSDSRAWDERLKEAKARRRAYLKPELVQSPKDWTYEPTLEAKPSLKERVFKWVYATLFG